MRKIINDKIEDILNTTSMQQWYYNLYKERKDMKSLMMDLEFEFLGTIDLDLLTESWKLVLEKYPMLRTVFYETKKHELFQVIYKNCSPEIDSVNWRGIAAYRQEVLGRNLRIEQEKRGVDLQVAPLSYPKKLERIQFSLVFPHLAYGWMECPYFIQRFNLLLLITFGWKKSWGDFGIKFNETVYSLPKR